jgi:hypothetical protein
MKDLQISLLNNGYKVNIIDIEVGRDYKRLIDNINKCQYIISSSLHGIIMGLIYKKKTIYINFSSSVVGGDFKFDDALLMTPHQAADLVWKAGLIGKTPQGTPTGWADVHPLFYNVKDDPQVFVIGDSVGAVSPHFGHYPKSGHVANKEGRAVAQYISQQARGQALTHVMIDNLCYMLVNNTPREAISVQFDYKLGADGLLQQTQIDDNQRRPELWQEDLRWVEWMYQDFLKA